MSCRIVSLQRMKAEAASCRIVSLQRIKAEAALSCRSVYFQCKDAVINASVSELKKLLLKVEQFPQHEKDTAIEELMYHAEGNLEVLEILGRLVEHGARCFDMALRGAAGKNNYEAMEWSLKHGATDFNLALRHAVNTDNPKTMRWCAAHGADWFDDALWLAGHKGKLVAAMMCIAWGADASNPALHDEGVWIMPKARAWLARVASGEIVVRPDDPRRLWG